MISYAATRIKLSHDPDALTDVVALQQALRDLFPRRARDLLKPHVPAKFSYDEVAQVARRPVGYVEFVLSDDWEREYDAKLAVGDALNGGQLVEVMEKEEGIVLHVPGDFGPPAEPDED